LFRTGAKPKSAKSRVEIIRTEAGWHLSIKARNGQTLVWSEIYKRKRDALNCLSVLRKVIGEKPDIIDQRPDGL